MGDFSLWHRPGGLGAAGGANALVATEEYTTRANMHYTRGISRPGTLDVEIHSLDGATAPAVGDYVEVRYSGAAAPPWSGVVREATQDQDDKDLWHILAADPLAEVDKRNVGQRVSYASTNESAVALDILSRMGITNASYPIRIQAGSILDGGAGAAIDATGWATQYQDGLPALRALAMTYGREISYKRESNGAGGYVWTLYYAAYVPDSTHATVSQATWACGASVGKLKDITDDWDKAQGVTVIPEGSGTSNAPQTAGAPSSSDPQYAIPAKGVKGTTAALAMASTLQSIFSANRRVLVAPTGFAEPLTDGGLDLGYAGTLQDENAANIGLFRIVHLEVDEEAEDGYYSRATFLTTTIPALTSVTGPAGVRQPGLMSQEDIQQQDAAFQQPTDTQATSFQNGVTAGGSFTLNVPANSTQQTPATAFSSPAAPADFGRAEAFWLRLTLQMQVFGAFDAVVSNHTHGVTMVSDTDSAGNTYQRATSPTQATQPGLVPCGPFIVELFLGDAALQVLVASWTIGHVRGGDQYRLSNVYPFALTDNVGGYNVTHYVVKIANQGGINVLFDVGSGVAVHKKPLHQHNNF